MFISAFVGIKTSRKPHIFKLFADRALIEKIINLVIVYSKWRKKNSIGYDFAARQIEIAGKYKWIGLSKIQA